MRRNWWVILVALCATLPGDALAATGVNGRIAFVSNRDGNAEIYSAESDGSAPLRLTNAPAADAEPAWSPDGSQIAFARGFDIWVMRADGTEAAAITSVDGVDAEPAWSPDGTQLAFVSNRNIAGGGTTGPEIWVMNADGTGIRQVTDTTGAASLAPAWSPAGDQIAFHSNVDGENEIYTIAASSTPPGTGTDTRAKLTDNLGIQDQNPTWSPDGAQIAFERGSGTNVGDTTKEIWVMGSGGAGQVQRTTNATYDVQPSWSPDGTRIAYVSNADGDLEVVSMPAGGGAPASVTSTAAGINDEQPAWGGIAATAPPVGKPTGEVTDPGPVGTGGGAPTAPSGTPVIFIHGFLGARIGCPPDPKAAAKGSAQEVWPNIDLIPTSNNGIKLTSPDFDRMRLAKNGVSNLDNGDRCTETAAVTGLVRKVLTSDIYDGTVKNLEGLGRPFYAYTYDWRRSPQLALAGLDALVERARQETGSAKVVLFAHSMGGLVTRWYIDDRARAAKVSRALTVGTPYWGSAKAWLPLVRGFESQGFARFNPLDVLIHNPDAMKRWAQNLAGLYYLYPSANWYRARGPWLSFEDEYGGRWLDFPGVVTAIFSQQGTTNLARAAYAGHRDHLDGFKTNGVDFRAVVGTGLETLTKVREHRRAWIPFTDYTYGDGDGTVPSFSGFQQLNARSPVLGESIPRHYVCGVDHNALATDRGLFAGVAGFLRDGTDITLPRASSGDSADQRGFCGRAGGGGGRQIVIHGDGSRGPGLPDVDIGPRAGAARAAQAGSGALELHEAAAAGVVDVLERGDRTVIVTHGDQDPAVTVRGRNLAVESTQLLGERKGRTVAFEARSGRLVTTGGSATLNGRRLKASARDTKPPRTRVTVRRKGRTAVLTARVTDKSRVRATYVQVGRAKRRVWRRPLRVAVRKLRSVRYGSVDVFGNAEAPRRVAR